MHLNILHLDDAFAGQADFMAACEARSANQVSAQKIGAEVRLWGRRAAMEKLQGRLKVELKGLKSDQPVVTWMGSGDFHHVTALIASCLADARGMPFTIVHIDNHPDWVKFRNGIHCGSWVSYVLKNRIAERVVSVGMTSGDLSCPELKHADLSLIATQRQIIFPLHETSTFVVRSYGSGRSHRSCGMRLSWKRFGNNEDNSGHFEAAAAVETEAIYVTLDKDALAPADAATNWDQGTLRLDGVLEWLRALMSRHIVLGVDVIGDRSTQMYGGSNFDRLLKRSEALLDQPRLSPGGSDTPKINQAANLKLLAALEDQLC